MRPSGFRADTLTVAAVTSPAGITINYTIDGRPPASVEVPLASVPPQALDLVVAASAIYLGSLCLARDVPIHRPMPAGMLEELGEIAEMLYDIRRWRDALPLDGSPTLRPISTHKGSVGDQALDPHRSVVLWSGGKDSTLALITLRANGYSTHPVHATVNAGAEAPERRAVSELAPLLGVSDIEELAVSHPDFLEVSSAYATAWDAFPLSNRVPFGRDLWLAALAVPIALRVGAAHVSLGHDYECRNAEVLYERRRIPRNDMESTRAALIFEDVVRRHVHPALGLLPPVANVPELRILRDMFCDHPELMARTSFCFWGRNCGVCGKCLRYFLADRLYSPGLLSFEANPLADGACPELQEILTEPSALFQREVMVLLGRLAQRRDIRDGEPELERFRAHRLPEIEGHLDAWEAELLAEYDDPQIPSGFRPASVMTQG